MPTLLQELQKICAHQADAQRAVEQQAYMKSALPFWGIAKDDLDCLCKELFKTAKPQNNQEYGAQVREFIWFATHREEWYAGITYARMFKAHVSQENIPLYIDIVRFTQWWDIVDVTAVHLVGKVLLNSPERARLLRAWIKDENKWVRRTALLAQLKYKEKTDFDVLCELVGVVAHEREFFIAKAIGWVLREYSQTAPDAVMAFIKEHENTLAPLAVREGTRIVKAKMPEIYARYF